MRAALVLLALISAASGQTGIISGTVSGTIGQPVPPGFPTLPTIDTFGIFGPAGANLYGDSISVSFSYNPAGFSGTGSCGTNCTTYQDLATNQVGNSVSVTINGVTKTYNAPSIVTSIGFQNSFAGYSANFFSETISITAGVNKGSGVDVTLFSFDSVAFGSPIQNIVPGENITFSPPCTANACPQEVLNFIIGGLPKPLQITTSSLPNAISGQPYSATLAATGGSGNYTWRYSSPGSLPPGFTLSSTGVLSSTGNPPAPPGSYSFLAHVTDSRSDFAAQQLNLVVNGLTVAPQALSFQIQQGTPAQSQSLQIGSAPGMAWQATAATSLGGTWLSLSQASGQGPAQITAMADPSGLTPGTYQGNITLAAPAIPLVITINVTLTVAAVSGQNGIITTVAGNGHGAFSGDGGLATSASLSPWGVAVDSSGNLFIADGFSRILKVSGSGIITTVAGNGTQGFSGDGGPATSASLNYPEGIAVDASGNLFIADLFNNRIREVSAGGIITTVVGNGINPCVQITTPNGDGGPATSASVCPDSVTLDSHGNLFIGESARVRKVSTSGIITTVAGNGLQGFSGDGGPATSAMLSAADVAVDASGDLFIADWVNNRVRKVSASGIITTVAGTGSFGHYTGGFSGDGGPATSALLDGPLGVAVDGFGNFFIADSNNNRIRRVSVNGTIATAAGSGRFGLINMGNFYQFTGGFSGDGGPATSATLSNAVGVAVDAFGNLFVADNGNSRVREVQTVSAVGGVQNAASYASGAVSPGEIVILYGVGMGPATLTGLQVDSGSGLVETTVAGTTVLFNGVPAPIVYTSANQVSVVVPYEIASAATANIVVNYQSNNVAAGTVTVAPSAPGIFTVGAGTAQAAALNQDGSVNSASNPAAAGSTIVLYLTGEGQTTPAGVDGKIASGTPYPAPILPVTVTIGGQTAGYAYAGAAPGDVAGVTQINATIPSGLTGNAVPVSVQIGSAATQNGVTIAVQ